MKEWLIAVCDDDDFWRKTLMKDCMKIVENEERVLGFSDERTLLEAFESGLDIGLVFMDIMLDDVNGIDVKKELEVKGYSPYVVYVTSFAGFMNKAFGFNVLGFIEKPVNLVEVRMVIEEVELRLKDKYVLEATDVDNNSYFLALKQIEMIHIDDHYSTVCFLESGSSKSPIHKKIIMRKSLSYWENILDKDLFFRVNKSTIVNLGAIECFEKNSVTCCGERIKISRMSKEGFKRAFMSYKKYYGR